MATVLRFKRRASAGATGAPGGLATAEPAYNMADGVIYIGFGDDGSGNATSIKAIAQDNFWKNIPSDGSTGDILQRTATGIQWAAAPQGGVTYTEGNGIDITGTVVSVDPATIPGISASKITSGTFTTGLIPDLAATKITSGTFDTARIPNLDAAKIASGVLDPARIPVLPTADPVIPAGGTVASLTVGEQAEVGTGTVVVTTDGRRWIYKGSGSKTAEASYIEMADVTPEWSVIANKPIFATVATSGSYTDLTNKPTLGTMAAQNANAVAITGGTIDGVTLDGGTF